ncbi:hypothetical protein GMOD_00002641 [Pyrenophora seminiperda CCB06]|uniref:Uncharacterized protein n=1 Tax=Pyrenophora seminiperda CCB06 TaxID=1302712 RepID=A0A3M7M2T9_9PLEO|nr:hypothetical protein GMOD_00002641 [Pyrenophora seminiperda CCB06]
MNRPPLHAVLASLPPKIWYMSSMSFFLLTEKIKMRTWFLMMEFPSAHHVYIEDYVNTSHEQVCATFYGQVVVVMILPYHRSLYSFVHPLVEPPSGVRLALRYGTGHIFIQKLPRPFFMCVGPTGPHLLLSKIYSILLYVPRVLNKINCEKSRTVPLWCSNALALAIKRPLFLFLLLPHSTIFLSQIEPSMTTMGSSFLKYFLNLPTRLAAEPGEQN